VAPKQKTTLLDIINEFQDSTGGTRSRVLEYERDGVTPLVIEYERTDAEGTVWITRRNLKTGDVRLRQIPGDR
jgi:hypothetical protein